MRGKFFLSLALVLAAASSASATSNVIYTDFGTTGTGFQAAQGWAVTGSSPVVSGAKNEAIGADFSISGSTYPTGVKFAYLVLAIGEYPAYTVTGAGTNASPAVIVPKNPEYGTDSFKITLTTSSSGEPSTGAALETWDNVALPDIVPTLTSPTTSKAVTFSSPTLTLITSLSNLNLLPGQTYWVTAAPESDASNSTAVWSNTTLPGAVDPAIGTIASNNSISWLDDNRISPAFSVNGPSLLGTGVPAPASAAGGLLLMAGLFGAKWFSKATAK